MQPSLHAGELASVENLPLDKFDEYLPADTLPYPWHTIGQLSDDLKVLLQPWAESDITGNLISGKGVEILDNSKTDGQGIGFGMNFIQAPVGPIMLTFDYRVNARAGDYKTMELAVNLGRGSDATVQLFASIAKGLLLKTQDGKLTKLADCARNQWYHVAILGRTDSADIKIAVTPHPSSAKIGYPNVGTPAAYVDYKLPQVWGQPTDLNFTSVAQAKATGAWNIDNVCLLGEVTAPRQAYWPFVPDMSDANAKKKVFSYAFTPFSANRATKDSKLQFPYVDDPTLGWAFWSWQNLTYDLAPNRVVAGCKLQYIAYPRVPVPGFTKEQAKTLEMQEEVTLGSMMNMDGFIIDFSANEDNEEWKWLNFAAEKLMDAAAQTKGKFAIIPAVYCASKKSGTNGEADQGYPAETYSSNAQLRRALQHPGAFHNEQGQTVMSMWLSEKHSATWWKQVFENLAKDNIHATLFTQFNSTGSIKSFTDVAYGMAHWGPRTPATTYNWYEAARPYTNVLGYPICAQDVRTRGAQLMGESENSRTIRKLWMDAITKDADWAIINTWTDYTEHAQMPSTAIGFGLYDLNAYYTQWFKTDKQPAIVKDALYYIHRRQHTDAPQLHGVRWGFGKSEPMNNIELLAFLKAPGTLVVKVDGQVYRQQAEAGITSFMVPLPKDKRFVPYFAVERDGSETLGGQGRYTVYDKVDFPNLLYHYGVIVK
jgi:hypothetical protein